MTFTWYDLATLAIGFAGGVIQALLFGYRRGRRDADKRWHSRYG